MLFLPDGLVWIASFPKSGNTWVRILLSNLIAGQSAPQDINDLALKAPIAASRHAFELETLIDSSLLSDVEAERLRPLLHDAMAETCGEATFAKTHDAFIRMPDGTPLLGRRARAALYVVRDPRDVAVSLAKHMGLTIDGALEMMNAPTSALGGGDSPRQLRQPLTGWSGHAQSWLDQSQTPTHLMRYEDLLADTQTVFRGALDFLGAAYEPQAVGWAARNAEFGELQRQEQENGFRERVEGQASFFRKGEAGDWRRHLSAKQARAIEETHAVMMARLGYEPEMRGERP